MPILINDFTRGALDNNSKISKHLHCPMVITLKNGKQIVKYKCKTLNWNVIQSENLRAETLDRNWSILIHCLMITSLQDWAQKSYPWSFQIGDLALVSKNHVWPPGDIPRGADDVGGVWLPLHQVASLIFDLWSIFSQFDQPLKIWSIFSQFDQSSQNLINLLTIWSISPSSAPLPQRSVFLNCLHTGRWSSNSLVMALRSKYNFSFGDESFGINIAFWCQ